jgi:hypothetical protein
MLASEATSPASKAPGSAASMSGVPPSESLSSTGSDADGPSASLELAALAGPCSRRLVGGDVNVYTDRPVMSMPNVQPRMRRERVI